jgi:intracellular septation protein
MYKGQDSTKAQTLKSQWKFLVFGGLLPVLIFTFIESKYGAVWATIAALIFGIIEITYEKISTRQVSMITWVANGLIFFLGLITIFTDEGIWFKLQPAFLELGFAGLLWFTSFMKKPMLLELAKKQNPQIPASVQEFLSGINLRLGFFFLFQAALATWAAFSWSTEAWAALKGLGVILMMIVYLALEILLLRRRVRKN